MKVMTLNLMKMEKKTTMKMMMTLSLMKVLLMSGKVLLMSGKMQV
jgi:hypothetical protein